MVESTDKHRGVGSKSVSHADSGVFKRMKHILHHQALLGIKSQELILGDVEEGPVEIGGVFSEEMPSLYMKLDPVQHTGSLVSRSPSTHRASMLWIWMVERLGIESFLRNGRPGRTSL